MAQDLVLYEADAKVGIVTLNRPEKLNALNTDLRRELAATLTKADDDHATSVIVLRGAGRSFCVGYDIAGGSGDEEWRHDALKYHARLSTSLALELMPWYLRKPVVASVQGHALGGGCELAMFCDLTIAADDAMFGEPESRFSQTGPGFVMPWIIGFKKARELLYLGDMIDARTALDLGMVNRIVPREELAAQTAKLAKRIALVAPETLAATKLAINRGADAAGFRNAMQAGIDVIAPLYAAKTEIGTEFRELARKEGLGAALKWRKAQFETLILRRSNYLTMIVTEVNRCPPLGPTRSIVLPRTLTVTLASLGPQSRPCRRTISTPDGAARAAPHVTTLRSLADAAAQHIIVIRQATVNARIGSPFLQHSSDDRRSRIIADG